MKVFKKGYVVFVNMDEDDPLVDIIVEASAPLLEMEMVEAMIILWEYIPEGYLLTATGGLPQVVKLPTSSPHQKEI